MVKLTLTKIKREIILQKEGLVIGALAGIAVTYWLKFKGTDFMFAIGRHGIIDKITGPSMEAAQVAEVKVLIVMVAVFMAMGFMIDKIIYPRR